MTEKKRQLIIAAVAECTGLATTPVKSDDGKCWILPQMHSKEHYKQIIECIKKNPWNNSFQKRGLHQPRVRREGGNIILTT